MFGDLGGGADELGSGRAGADDSDLLAGDVEVLGPGAGVHLRARETVPSLDVGEARGRQRPERADDVACGELLAAVGPYGPQTGGLVVGQRLDRGVELDVVAQVVPVDHVLQIGQDLRLGRVAGLPVPLPQQVGVEGVAVRDAVDIGGRARIAVPVPGAPDTGPPLEGPHVQAECVAELVQHVDTGESGAYDDRVEVGRFPGHSGLSARAGQGNGVVHGWILTACRPAAVSGVRRYPASR